jgi:hypothetical protein
MRRYLPATTFLVCAAMLAPAVARAQRGGGGHGGGGGHAGGGGSMHGSSMGGGSMHSSGSFGGGQAHFAPRSFSPPRATGQRTVQRAPYSPGRSPFPTRAPMPTRGPMAPRPGFVFSPSRDLRPRSGTPTRPTYNRLTPERRILNPVPRRGVGRRERFDRDRRFRGFNTFGPIIFWGSPYLYDSCFYDYDYYCDNYPSYGPGAPYADQPDQQVVDQDRYAPASSGAGGATETAWPDQPASSNQTNSTADDWVLVRKDGGLIFTSAFIVHEGQISYISSEGILRKVMLTDLDLVATHKFNDERGATISLPN